MNKLSSKFTELILLKRGELSSVFTCDFFAFYTLYSYNMYVFLYLSNEMSILVLIMLWFVCCVLYYFLLPVIKPLQLISNRIFRKIHLYNLWKWWVLRWKQKKKYPVIIQYDPPEWINSAEAWFLLHRYASSTDIFSLLYKWQAEWLISISVEKTKNWEKIKIKKMKDIWHDSPSYENLFFGKLFLESKVRELTRFSDISSLCDTEMLEEYWVVKWWFQPKKTWNTIKDELIHNKKIRRIILFVLAMIIILILYNIFSFKNIFFLYHWWIEDVFPVLWFAIFVIGFWILLKNPQKFKRTDEGDKLASQILWFRMFVKQCDENKLKELMKSDPMYFSEIVSYAVVFWLETNLLKNIIPMMDKDIDPFDWYYWKWENLSDFSDVF